MTNAEYVETQNALVTAATQIAALDLEGFVARINQAEALAPILDPTAYRVGGAILRGLKVLAERGQAMRVAVMALRAEAAGPAHDRLLAAMEEESND